MSFGEFSADLLKEATLATLVEHKDEKIHFLDDVGFVTCSVSSQGTVVVVGDGLTHVDVNVEHTMSCSHPEDSLVHCITH